MALLMLGLALKPHLTKFYLWPRALNNFLVATMILPIGRTIKLGKWSLNWEGPFIVTQDVYAGAYKLSTLKVEELRRSINGKYLKKYYPMMRDSINIITE